MKALHWYGSTAVRAKKVSDPTIREPTDALLKVTNTAIWDSDLHIYHDHFPIMHKGDIFGRNSWARSSRSVTL